MAGDADLELGLRWDRSRGGFAVHLRYDRAGSNLDRWQPIEDPLRIDVAALTRLAADEPAYGRALTDAVLRPGDIRTFYEEIRAASAQDELHVRLHIDAPARFHALRWESLRDPDTQVPLATQSDILLSRYLSSASWRPVPVLPQHRLRALLVVSAPDDVESLRVNGRGLAPVDLQGELDRAREALASFGKPQELSGREATLSNLLDALDRGVDILYLVCHGWLDDDVPKVVLENSDGRADVIDGRKLVERLLEIKRRPTIAMLCSCQSASDGDQLRSTDDDGALSALGPRLAAADVAAVVAMQGNMRMTTAARFVPSFFEALSQHGIVDRAVAEARRSIREAPDWWAPVLFSRLRSGRTYYRPQFAERADATWETLRLQIRTGNFTPVLGPGLADAILGSREDIAERWAVRWQMPLVQHTRGDLAQVAEYLSVSSAPGTPRSQLIDHLNREIASREATAKPDTPFHDLQANGEPASTILEVGRRLRHADEGDAYRVLAALPVSVYVTTNWTDLLEAALLETDPPRPPMTMWFPWKDNIDGDAWQLSTNEQRRRLARLPQPTPTNPLVYHLFGHLDDVSSVVLSEDDYFAWIQAWIERRKSIPTVVRKALTAKSMLFLGYRLDDWDFRVVFHGIKSFGGSARLIRENQHVGVQLSPQNPTIEPEAAQEYLEKYFGEDKVTIWWGETRSFLDELRARTGLPT